MIKDSIYLDNHHQTPVVDLLFDQFATEKEELSRRLPIDEEFHGTRIIDQTFAHRHARHAMKVVLEKGSHILIIDVYGNGFVWIAGIVEIVRFIPDGVFVVPNR